MFDISISGTVLRLKDLDLLQKAFLWRAIISIAGEGNFLTEYSVKYNIYIKIQN